MYYKLCVGMLVMVLIVAVIGYWRGWFMLSGHGASSEGDKVDIHLSVDPDKMTADAKAVKQKASELTNSVTTQTNEPTEYK